jgi:signal transduction histidine kinase
MSPARAGRRRRIFGRPRTPVRLGRGTVNRHLTPLPTQGPTPDHAVSPAGLLDSSRHPAEASTVARPEWRPGAETAFAVVLGAGWFALSAILLSALGHPHPMAFTIAGVAVNVAVVLVFARYGGIGVAVAVGVAGVVALDWYAIPPVHTVLVPDLENAFALCAYLVTGTLLGQLAAATRRRAEASEREASALAAEQAALRRVATVVAREGSPDEVFALVTEEVARLLSIDIASLLRYESDGTATVVATWSGVRRSLPVGFRVELAGDSVTAAVLDRRGPARLDSYQAAQGDFAVTLRGMGVRASAGSPVMVGGVVWGVMIGASLSQPIPQSTEFRLGQFTELAATALANAEARGELKASRARIVASGDDARRRIERNLHDGVQQRLVSLAFDARRVEGLATAGEIDLAAQVGRLREGLVEVVDDLRELSHGIHPAILSDGGLRPALATLARRSPLPLELDLPGGDRLPEPVEVCVYYVVSEAMTNAIKHAQATHLAVRLHADRVRARLDVRDDGVGGVDARRGSGLIGLSDRVNALGGTMDVNSPVGVGTTLRVRLPLAGKGESSLQALRVEATPP